MTPVCLLLPGSTTMLKWDCGGSWCNVADQWSAEIGPMRLSVGRTFSGEYVWTFGAERTSFAGNSGDCMSPKPTSDSQAKKAAEQQVTKLLREWLKLVSPNSKKSERLERSPRSMTSDD